MKRDSILCKTTMGDTVVRREESIIIEFKGRRNVVSTSNLNGGYREDLHFAYNNSCGKNPLILQRKCPGMKGRTLEEHYAVIAEEHQLPKGLTTGMGTAALMENVAFVTKQFEKLSVMAIATAGIDVNGGSAGDLARYNEFTKKPINMPVGTINIFLLIDAKVAAGVLTRALVTATEAKSVALRELAAPSMYSEEIATGSGTDSLIVIGNLDSELELYGAGKHCILGQLIGQVVIEAVKKALDKQSGMNPVRQSSIIWQGKRYGITTEKLYSDYKELSKGTPIPYNNFLEKLHNITTDNHNVAYAISVFNLIDQYRWGMINNKTLEFIGGKLINDMRDKNKLAPMEKVQPKSHYEQLISMISKTLLDIILITI